MRLATVLNVFQYSVFQIAEFCGWQLEGISAVTDSNSRCQKIELVDYVKSSNFLRLTVVQAAISCNQTFIDVYFLSVLEPPLRYRS